LAWQEFEGFIEIQAGKFKGPIWFLLFIVGILLIGFGSLLTHHLSLVNTEKYVRPKLPERASQWLIYKFERRGTAALGRNARLTAVLEGMKML
jgi:hypothetical protein